MMRRKSRESNELRTLHDTIAQLNQQIQQLETDKVFPEVHCSYPDILSVILSA